jgi:hypothetical protein
MVRLVRYVYDIDLGDASWDKKEELQKLIFRLGGVINIHYFGKWMRVYVNTSKFTSEGWTNLLEGVVWEWQKTISSQSG